MKQAQSNSSFRLNEKIIRSLSSRGLRTRQLQYCAPVLVESKLPKLTRLKRKTLRQERIDKRRQRSMFENKKIQLQMENDV